MADVITAAVAAIHRAMDQKKNHSRDFPGRRLLIVALRTVHLAGVVLLGAALLYSNADHRLAAGLTLGSGLLLLALDTWAKPRHLLELSGASILLKLGLVAWMIVQPAAALPLFWVVLAISGLISHAPGAIRHRPVYRRPSKS